jgi:hypothetical protein
MAAMLTTRIDVPPDFYVFGARVGLKEPPPVACKA